jgi:hypothetical protein
MHAICTSYSVQILIAKNKICWRKIVIFHTKYPKMFAPSSGRRNFFKCAPLTVENHDFTPTNLIFCDCGGRRENFWGISCEKSRFYDKKSYFFQLRREARKLLGYFVWKITISKFFRTSLRSARFFLSAPPLTWNPGSAPGAYLMKVIHETRRAR